ncbi:spermatogenesis-associated protein 2-like protein [Apus apus]|uniref:spermatogenesis-associated protein 2-like protein n=1 Tax=Apus apus TaxID=8895 RepID=UPI0021F89B3E|nr:spermatogenesis-associated protein 2-like protein [Apus apus]
MCAGSALRQEYGQEHRERHLEQHRDQYRRCLEREPCSRPSFEQRLRQELRREPALLGALQPEAPSVLARGLQGHPELGPALRGLASAFRLLELAAANLHLYPWRREFGTIQTFSGAYTHLLRPVLPEADLVRSFGRLGYEQRDPHSLVLSQLPPEPELVATACGFLACRLECEILAEVLARLWPQQVSAQELLEARRVAGDPEACLEVLRRGTQRQDLYREVPRRGCQAADDSVDLYQEPPASPEEMEGEDVAPPALWKDPSRHQGWHCKHGQEPVPSIGSPGLDNPSSPLFPESELGTGRSPPVLGEQDLPPAAPRLTCYQLHSCLGQGALPSYCCGTCQQLHAGGCAAGRECRSRHRGQELHGERQQRLWLQRTEVDMLLADSTTLRS